MARAARVVSVWSGSEVDLRESRADVGASLRAGKLVRVAVKRDRRPRVACLSLDDDNVEAGRNQP
jgi:hypothetical protein